MFSKAMTKPQNSVVKGQYPRTTVGTESVSIMVLSQAETVLII